MNLLEKYFRRDMPQISTKDIDAVKEVFEEHDINFEVRNIKVVDLDTTQHGVKKEKVKSIAEEIEKNGLESLPMMLVSEDMEILDGHHRKYGIIEAEGRDAEADVLMLKYPTDKSFDILKKLESKLSETIGKLVELNALCNLHGTFSRGVLLGKGFRNELINEAISAGLLKGDKFGHLTTIPNHMREARLAEIAPFVVAGARMVPAAAKVLKGVGKVAKGAANTKAGAAAGTAARAEVGKGLSDVITGKTAIFKKGGKKVVGTVSGEENGKLRIAPEGGNNIEEIDPREVELVDDEE